MTVFGATGAGRMQMKPARLHPMLAWVLAMPATGSDESADTTTGVKSHATRP